MKNVLFTSVTFKNYAGSELVTLTEVNYFLDNNYNVDIFSIEKGKPLIDELDKSVTVITLENINDLKDHYDYIISRQYPLLDYILFSKKVTAEKVYYQSVSYRIPIDFFPQYYKELSLTGVASRRIQEELENKGYETSNSYYFPNYAPKECFEYQYIPSKKLEKIAIVTNHIPSELEEFATIAKKNGLIVDIYGMHHTYKLVTPELLGKYNVIISIGKTIFYSIAMGIPSYTYDQLVTEGYISKENYTKNLKNNMAYSKEYNKKSGQEIYFDILDGYDSILKDLDCLKEYGKHDFYFNTLMDKFMTELNNSPSVNYDHLYSKYPTILNTGNMYVEDVYFYRQEIQKWYKKSLELGELYQIEIDKFIDVNNKLDRVINSKGWKLLERIRKLIKR